MALVFAKVRSYCPWPGKVVCSSPMPNKSIVKLFGHTFKSWELVDKSKIWPFEEFKEGLGQGDESQDFLEAMKEAENVEVEEGIKAMLEAEESVGLKEAGDEETENRIEAVVLSSVENNSEKLMDDDHVNPTDGSDKLENVNGKENVNPVSRGKGGKKSKVNPKKRNPLKLLLDDESDVKKKFKEKMKEIGSGYQCIECGFGTGIMLSAKTHAIKCGTARKKSKIKKKDHKCTVCNQSFNTKKLLNIHFQDHKTSRYKCTTCGKEFNERKKFSRHLLNHSNQSNFECKFCAKPCRDNTHLQRHLRSHKPRQKRGKTTTKMFERGDNLGEMEVEENNEVSLFENNCESGENGQSGAYSEVVFDKLKVVSTISCEVLGQSKEVESSSEKKHYQAHLSTSSELATLQNTNLEGVPFLINMYIYSPSSGSEIKVDDEPESSYREGLSPTSSNLQGDAQLISGVCGSQKLVNGSRQENPEEDSRLWRSTSSIPNNSISQDDFFTNSIMSKSIVDDLLAKVVTNCSVNIIIDELLENVVNNSSIKRKKYFPCPKCNKISADNAHLKDHLRRMHTPGLFECKRCNKIYVDKYDLTQHERICFYVCKNLSCLKMFKNKNKFDAHCRWHITMAKRML